MALRFVLFRSSDDVALCNSANKFCAEKGISPTSKNKVINDPPPEVKWNSDTKEWYITLTVDIQGEVKGQKAEQRELNTEGGVTFNVMTDEEKKEIERLQQEEQQKVAST